MPTLSEITKVFLHGETLESLELNAIISLINSTIRKINSVERGLNNHEYSASAPISNIYCRTKNNVVANSFFPTLDAERVELFELVSNCETTQGIKYNGTFSQITISDNAETMNGVWTAYPQGVTEDLPLEWEVSYKTLDNETIYISGPVLRSNFGFSGMDGDSILYVYKLFDHELSQIERGNILSSELNIEDLEDLDLKDYGWFDDPQNPTQQYPFEYVSTKKKTNGTWGNFSPIALWAKYSEDGVNGDFLFRVYKRSVTAPETPVGGRYDSPTPSGWEPSVPSGSDPVWSSTKIFKGSGEDTNTWSIPTLEADTVGIDIEYSPDNEKPSKDTLRDNPGDSHPHADHLIWYDASNTTIDLSTMIWRAERKIKNGAYEGEWVITRIKGEELSELQITVTPLNIILDLEDVLASGTDIQIDDVVSTITVYALDGTTLNYNKFGIINANIYADGYTVNNEQAPLTPALDYLEITGIVGDTLNARTIKIKRLPISLNDSYVYTYNKGHIEVNLLVTVGESLRTMKVEIPWYLNRLGERLTRLKGDLLETLMSKEVFNEGNNSPERIKLNGLISTSASEVITRLEKQISGTNLISDNGWGTSFSSEDIASRRRTQCSPFVYLTPGDYILSAYINTNAVINNYFELNIKQSNSKVDPSTLLSSYITSEWNSLNIQGILSADPNIEFSGDYYPEGTNNYVRVYFTFTVVGSLETGTYKEGYYTFHFSKLNSSNTGLLTCIRPQLECNSTPTTWSPGPQDFSSEIRQTADEIDLSIKNDFAETGLTIDGENNEIKLKAGLVKFVDSNNQNNEYFLINSDGKAYAEDIELRGELTSAYGRIGEIPVETVDKTITVYTPDGQNTSEEVSLLSLFDKNDPRGDRSKILHSSGNKSIEYTLITDGNFNRVFYKIAQFNSSELLPGKIYSYYIKAEGGASDLLGAKFAITQNTTVFRIGATVPVSNGKFVLMGFFKLLIGGGNIGFTAEEYNQEYGYDVRIYSIDAVIREAYYTPYLYFNFTNGYNYFNNSAITGSHRSPFKFTDENTGDAFINTNGTEVTYLNTDNITLLKHTSNYQLKLPWDYTLSGRRVFINNGVCNTWTTGTHTYRNSTLVTTSANIIIPSGYRIFKDGIIYTDSYKIPAHSMIELLGIGEGASFFGWIVLNEYNLAYGNTPKTPFYKPKVIAMGTITVGLDASHSDIFYKCSDSISISLEDDVVANEIKVLFVDSNDVAVNVVEDSSYLTIIATPLNQDLVWIKNKSRNSFTVCTGSDCEVDFVVYDNSGF